jgi:hypothetical protein
MVDVSLQGSIPWRFVFLANRGKEEKRVQPNVTFNQRATLGTNPTRLRTATREKRGKCNKKLGKK